MQFTMAELARNECMVYEEEVPVIVRRRGCMLRVRITSFADDVDESGQTHLPTYAVGIL